MTLSRRVDTMVSQQVSRWEDTARTAPARPCVAIASLPGTGGEEVGQRIALRLGFGCFGREIVDEIARRRGLPEELLVGLDGRMRSAIDRYVTDAFTERRFTETEFLREVVRLVTTLGQRGMAVLVGRGAAFILPPEAALRVLVTASPAFRIERFARERGGDPAAAAEALRVEDQQRGAFIAHHFAARLDDPSRYELSVNTETLGIEAAADIAFDAFQRRFPG